MSMGNMSESTQARRFALKFLAGTKRGHVTIRYDADGILRKFIDSQILVNPRTVNLF
jgi:hypothetical protein